MGQEAILSALAGDIARELQAAADRLEEVLGPPASPAALPEEAEE